jgi:aspartate 1-decarboxylase
MKRVMCKSKIHRATVTQADLNYVGSITIDKHLLNESGILPYEQVHVVNVTNGNRFVTYAIEGPEHSGVICVNGAAARLVAPDDLVIIIAYADYSEQELATFAPNILFVNKYNEIEEKKSNEEALTVYGEDKVAV